MYLNPHYENPVSEFTILSSWSLEICYQRPWTSWSEGGLGSWLWVEEGTHSFDGVHSFWKKGEPNNQGEEDCVELSGNGWNDNNCNGELFWICEKPSALCPGL